MKRVLGPLMGVVVLGVVVPGNLLAAEGAAANAMSPGNSVLLENDVYRITIDSGSGAISSFYIKGMKSEMIGEKRLADNFRICLPLEDYQANYIEGMKQAPAAVEKTGDTVTVRFSGMKSEKGEFAIDLAYTIALEGDQVRFRSKLTNRDKRPISEFWFPRLGGWTQFGANRGGLLAQPGYGSCGHWSPIFRGFPGGQGLGAETAECSTDYPGLVMPWWSIHDGASNRALYMGYHDTTMRLCTWHAYLFPNATGSPGDSWFTPEQAKGRPVGKLARNIPQQSIGPPHRNLFPIMLRELKRRLPSFGSPFTTAPRHPAKYPSMSRAMPFHRTVPTEPAKSGRLMSPDETW